jgi:hypothetical protein
MATKNLGKIVPKMSMEEYDPERTYTKLDLVPYQGSTYWSLVDDNKGNDPVSSSGYWILGASKGKDGGGYILPNATKESLGGVIVGDNLAITDGVLTTENVITNSKYEQDQALVYAEIDKKANNVVVTESSNGLMSVSDKNKLDNIEKNANNYTLPTASNTVLGGVKVGDNLSITNGTLNGAYKIATNANDGIISKESQGKLDSVESGANKYVLPNATNTSLGGVIVGDNLLIKNGVISSDLSTVETKVSANEKYNSLYNSIVSLRNDKYNNPIIITSETDLNSFTDNGYYSFTKEITNAPTEKGYLQNIVFSSVVVQYWYSSDNNLYMRSFNNEWSGWQELFTNLDLQAYFEKEPTILEGSSSNIINANTVSFGTYTFSVSGTTSLYFKNFPSNNCDGGLLVVANCQMFFDYTNNKEYVRFKSYNGSSYSSWQELVFKDYLSSYYLKTDTVDNAVNAQNADTLNVQEISDNYTISDLLLLESGKVYHITNITSIANKPSDATGECIVVKYDDYMYLYCFTNNCSYTYTTEWNKNYNDEYHAFADELTTTRNIALNGIVSGNTYFNGSKDVSINTSLAIESGVGTSVLTTDNTNIFYTNTSDISVGNANNATNDANGNNIATTYAKDNNTVHISGTETITGTKTFNGNVFTNKNFNEKLSDYAIAETPTSNITKAFQFIDRDNVTLSGMYYNANTDDTRQITLDVLKADKTRVQVVLDTLNQFYPNVNNSITLGSYANKWANVYATNFTGDLIGNATSATSATKATQDSDGNQINTTYSKVGHTHDDRYYTESEINTLITTALSGIYEGFGLSDYGSSPFGQSY